MSRHTVASVDRCAAPWCRRSILLDWNAIGCPCGEVVTCPADDPVDHCDECREARDG